jgi:2-keto-3-deoxy-L-fuconate dehydrogenase
MTDKHVVVTGGCASLGAAIVQGWVDLGAKVSVLDKQPGVDTDDVHYYLCDVSCPDAVFRSIKQSYEKNHRIDALIVNAGEYLYSSIEATSPETLASIFAVNNFAAYYCVQAVAPYMKKAKQGSIVFIASDQASVGRAGNSAYAMTKAALLQLARSLTAEFAPWHIAVNCLSPASIAETGMTMLAAQALAEARHMTVPAVLTAFAEELPSKQLIATKTVVETVLFLCAQSHDISGVNIPIDAGFSVTR